MARNTDYNIIDKSYDCNQKAVESAAVRTTNASKISMLPVESTGNLTEYFLKNNTSRKNGQSYL